MKKIVNLLQIPTEQKCRTIFYSVSNKNHCHYCQSKSLVFKNKYIYCNDCHHKNSAKSGVILFYSCNLSFQQIIALIWCWYHHLPASSTAKAIGVSYITAKKRLDEMDSAKNKDRIFLKRFCSKFFK